LKAGKNLHLKTHFLIKQEQDWEFIEVELDITDSAKLLLAFTSFPSQRCKK